LLYTPPFVPLRDLGKRIRRVFVGESRDPLDPEVFHQVSLAAFLAWVGLGADGLSSSCYGPEDAFRALGSHAHLAVFLAIAMTGTILIISGSYAEIIQLFPSGGGGYLVATRLLGQSAGLTSGAALVVDYALTIAMSVAAGVQALCSLVPGGVPQHRQLLMSLIVVSVLIVLNLRGIKESVKILMPIFLLFLLTHAAMIAFGIGRHVTAMPELVRATSRDTSSTIATLGIYGTLALLLRAFSLGGGTYTGIEAVSNGLQILREPRQRTGRRTMVYMAASLSLTASGLLLCYLLANVHKVGTETLNATLAKKLAVEALGAGHSAGVTVLLTLISEGALLFVAAQAGFLDGPRVLANMAIDFWVPTRFAHLSDRLVTQDGILVMGAAALATLFLTGGDVDMLVVLYSINVFLTFSLSQLGMVTHWWQVRRDEPLWLRKLALNGLGFCFTALILVVTLVLKFGAGGWVTSVMTGATIAVCVVVRHHYRGVHQAFRKLDDTLINVAFPPEVIPPARDCDPKAPTAALMVGSFNGLGLHSLLSIHRCFPNYFKNIVFLEVGIIDSSKFKGRHEVRRLEKSVEDDLREYEKFARNMGFYTESRHKLGTDAVAELEELCLETAKRYPRITFFAGKLVLGRETFFERYLHNQTAAKIERRLQVAGLHTVVMPIQATV
jgi:amino acid transporter